VPNGNVRITIRKRSATSQQDSAASQDPAVFVAKFSHVKRSLSTFLKFWLMGGCGADGWAGTGELEAQHTPSGTTASITVDVEEATVLLSSPAALSTAGNQPLSDYAVALLDELDSLAKAGGVAEPDRLCYPPEAIDSVRLAAWAACARREPADTASSEQNGSTGDGSEAELDEFEKFLKSLKK